MSVIAFKASSMNDSLISPLSFMLSDTSIKKIVDISLVVHIRPILDKAKIKKVATTILIEIMVFFFKLSFLLKVFEV